MDKNIPQNVRDIVDLRSDTVTRPTPEMYEAMMAAPLGDDVLGDDPTVARLEELAADITGKQAAMFVPSGTMGNQICIANHCRPGDAIIVEEDAHVLYYEVGAPAVVGGVVTWTIPSKLGIMDPLEIEKRILKRSVHTPGTALICIENTHNRAGGTIVPVDTMRAYRALADRHNVKLHLDGARMFNAAAALQVPIREITDQIDTVSFCLSKGLAAPVGSVVCGPADFMEEARVWRKRLGGGMRQSGLLAACGIVSLTKMCDCLEDDHRRARAMAAALAEMPGLKVDWDTVQTNMVIVTTEGTATEWLDKLLQHGVAALPPAPNKIRLVFHKDIDDAKLQRAIDAFASVSGAVARVQ